MPGFSCPQEYETKNYLSTDLSEENCCQLSCASFSCPLGYDVKKDFLPVKPTDRNQLNCCQLSICGQLHEDRAMPSQYDLLPEPITTETFGDCTAKCEQDPRCIAVTMERGPMWLGGVRLRDTFKCWLKSAWNHDDEVDATRYSYQFRGCDFDEVDGISGIGADDSYWEKLTDD